MTKHLESWLQNFPVLLSIRKFIIYFHGYHLLIFVILLTFFYYSVTDLQHRVSSRGTAWWLNISIHHKMIYPHHKFDFHLFSNKEIMQLLTIFPTLYISSLWLIYFVTGNVYLLISLTSFTHPPASFPSGNHLSVSLSMSLFLLCYGW